MSQSSKFLENQISAFKSTLTSSSSKVASKRTVTGTSASAQSTAPSSQASISKTQDLKRKRPEPSNVVYSQPANTGTGKNIMTQVTYAIEYLKTKGTPQTLNDLLSYLSIQYRDEEYQRTVGSILRNHDKVIYDANANGGMGSFSFRPVHDIRSGDSLLRSLQSQPTAKGLVVRDLRDGWPDAEEAIDQLESEGKLLVTRNKKDNHAKKVWPDDPSLLISIDDEFKAIWHKIKLPDPGALADELEREKLLPANKRRGLKVKPRVIEKKTKKPKRVTKTTNHHMVGILRDYSHLKK